MKSSKDFKKSFSAHSTNKLRNTRILPYFLALARLADGTQTFLLLLDHMIEIKHRHIRTVQI